MVVLVAVAAVQVAYYQAHHLFLQEQHIQLQLVQVAQELQLVVGQ
jgi:hypothetical protein